MHDWEEKNAPPPQVQRFPCESNIKIDVYILILFATLVMMMMVIKVVMMIYLTLCHLPGTYVARGHKRRRKYEYE